MGVCDAKADLVECKSETEIINACKKQILTGRKFFVLSAGSNTIVRDGGFAGKIVKINQQKIQKNNVEKIREDKKSIVFRVYAGVEWDDFVNFCIENNYAGVEALCGIPGLVGASCVQNIGAYGRQICDIFVSCEVFDFGLLKKVIFDRRDLEFGYRTSALKTKKINGCVLWVDFCLQKKESSVVGNLQLASALGVDIGSVVSIKKQANAILKIREEKGMLLTCFGKKMFSSGSFFLNPIVSLKNYLSLPEDVVAHKTEEGVKVSAAWLIEKSGIKKGFSLPGSRACVSPFHSLCILNTGGARAREVVELAEFIGDSVISQFGIRLVPEVNILG